MSREYEVVTTTAKEYNENPGMAAWKIIRHANEMGYMRLRRVTSIEQQEMPNGEIVSKFKLYYEQDQTEVEVPQPQPLIEVVSR